MTVAAPNFRDIFQSLPAGAVLRLSDIGWDEYEDILREFEERPGYRLTYNKGKLEIMSPRFDHENDGEFILRLADRIAAHLDMELETGGSTTLKRRWADKGAEPDTCFYIQNATQVAGKRNLDLNTDPPPDVAVEIDTTNESWRQFSIYADLGVPELWRYDGEQAEFYELRDGAYQLIPASRAFSLLTPQVLTQFLAQSKRQGQTAALRSFQAWLRQQISQ
jgi:Uma2 family endonuclease